MATLVLYDRKSDRLGLFEAGRMRRKFFDWKGEPFIVWITLEIAIGYGWEVIGEL